MKRLQLTEFFGLDLHMNSKRKHISDADVQKRVTDTLRNHIDKACNSANAQYVTLPGAVSSAPYM
jgi:hypothetical protein